MKTRKGKAASKAIIQKEFDKIEKLFAELEKDKTLPTFGEHFMQCLIFGVAENVNLKKMYPATYMRLHSWLKLHNKNILESRRNSKQG